MLSSDNFVSNVLITLADRQLVWVRVPGSVPLTLEVEKSDGLVGTDETKPFGPGTLVAHYAVVSVENGTYTMLRFCATLY